MPLPPRAGVGGEALLAGKPAPTRDFQNGNDCTSSGGKRPYLQPDSLRLTEDYTQVFGSLCGFVTLWLVLRISLDYPPLIPPLTEQQTKPLLRIGPDVAGVQVVGLQGGDQGGYLEFAGDLR